MEPEEPGQDQEPREPGGDEETQEPGGGQEPQEPGGDGEPQELSNQIRVTAFFTADHVDAVGGKLYVNGGFFDRLRFPAYPAIAPMLGIGASLLVPWHAYQQDHHFVVTLHDEDRRELPLRIEGSFRVGADILLRHGDPSIINLAGNVTNVVFERPGHYYLVLNVNGQRLARWGLQVVQLPAAFTSVAMPGFPQQ
jgi:hypothetical protein